MMMRRRRTKMVLETSVSFINLTQLIAREDFIESCHHESFVSYMRVIMLNIFATRQQCWLQHTIFPLPSSADTSQQSSDFENMVFTAQVDPLC
jgi:hypothetical protein